MLDVELNKAAQYPSARLLRLKDVQHRVGLGRSTIYRWMDEGKFPRPHPISNHSIRWLESDVDDWISSKVDDNPDR
ncbi:AlpA family transcriptional regulator [Sphingopyxis sp. BSNA05]|uniref:helix-turn-helix transcriptional regulator n=1 Tax=Sphingopyxis sp. BSNA05 TaxID=1236614 RepID=UPI0020B6FDE9|nr:AlpA family transcriptional regulator [Sphingopyxis sp. BSNA05]